MRPSPVPPSPASVALPQPVGATLPVGVAPLPAAPDEPLGDGEAGLLGAGDDGDGEGRGVGEVADGDGDGDGVLVCGSRVAGWLAGEAGGAGVGRWLGEMGTVDPAVVATGRTHRYSANIPAKSAARMMVEVRGRRIRRNPRWPGRCPGSPGR